MNPLAIRYFTASATGFKLAYIMKTGYLQSPVLALITVAVVAASCIDEPLLRATATIEDDLAADGCSIVIHIDDMEYAPDVYSRNAIRARKLSNMATVAIRYRLTGARGTIACGSGAFSRPEITFVFDE